MSTVHGAALVVGYDLEEAQRLVDEHDLSELEDLEYTFNLYSYGSGEAGYSVYGVALQVTSDYGLVSGYDLEEVHRLKAELLDELRAEAKVYLVLDVY